MNANAANFDPTGRQQQQQHQKSGMYQQLTGGESYGSYNYYEEDPSAGQHETSAPVLPIQYSTGGVMPGSNYPGGGDPYYTTLMESTAYYPDPSYVEQSAYSSTYYPAAAEPGSFYPHPKSPVLLPQVFGAPVTAIAYDVSYEALYVGSATQQPYGGHHSHHHHHRESAKAAALLSVHSSTLDGSLYASVAGHPEAPALCLSRVYSTIYGEASLSSQTTSHARRQHIPNHAYRPPYGAKSPTAVELLPSAIAASKSISHHPYHMGIQSLVPLAGYVASVSPSAVRVHAMGGLQIADWDVQGMLCGTAHPSRGGDVTTHMTVGGCRLDSSSSSSNTDSVQYSPDNNKHLFCVDLYHGLRIVSRASLDGAPTPTSTDCAVTALATSHSKGSIVAGCSDGFVRLFDGRGLRSLAKIKSHSAGVVDVVVSLDGNLVAATGYGSAGGGYTPSGAQPLYGFPDPTVLLYDIRYLGRGGFPHPFAGMRGGPRYLSFLPPVDGMAGAATTNRLLVASGQAGGGMQILRPFEEQSGSASDFLLPALERAETVTCLSVSQDDSGDAACLLSVGTSKGRILYYQMAGTSSSFQQRDKEPLVMPPFHPPVPPVSLQASLLQKEHGDRGIRPGPSENILAILSTLLFTADPSVSAIGDPRTNATTSFGSLASKPAVPSSRLEVSPGLLAKVDQTVDYLRTVPTASLDLDLFQDHRPQRVQERAGKAHEPKQNPNKILYSDKIFSMAYCQSLNRRSKLKSSRGLNREQGADDDEDYLAIPARYRLTLRPTHKSAASFSYEKSNQTGYLPGWDYPPTMPNAFAPPVLVLLYFIPEVRALAAGASLSERSSKDKNLLPELGLLFHRIESKSSFATLFPTEGTETTRIGAWAPSSFISFMSTMPEAEQLQILDGSPEAVDTPRRPEAFYRFLLYQLDKELGKNTSGPRMLDSLSGIAFTSINEFISGSGPPSKSSTRAMTLDMIYDPFLMETKEEKTKPAFGDVLQYNLCREKKLRAWNNQSGSYETIVQRKIATSLPRVLSLSCACAGRKESEGLGLWRTIENEVHWLPEVIEVELEDSGLVVVRELIVSVQDGTESWRECKGKGSIPSSVSELIRTVRDSPGPTKRRYRLDAVISMVRDDLDRNCPEEAQRDDGQPFVHHILHIRVPNATKRQLIERQHKELARYVSAEHHDYVTDMTVMGMSADKGVLQKRLEHTKDRLMAASNETSASGWVLMNGFVVSECEVEDARAFHVQFKEPSLVIFRALDNTETFTVPLYTQSSVLSSEVMWTLMGSTGSKSSSLNSHQKNIVLPGMGDLIAFDAEFVAVQDEESTLSETGSKLTVRETRHALARVSVVNCRDRSVIFDDHVLPREPVVDYLTRFSGILPNDLDPKQSPHHLISSRAAYLKLRYLLERGCIFVGHGLQQDFWMANLAVPSSQVIDTVEIFHQPAERYISLRFLTNFVLKRDMQQDVHDSVEDAMAAYELYLQAVELKKRGEFNKMLHDLYEYGRKTDWKLGMED